jgi:hypothetical protein
MFSSFLFPQEFVYSSVFLLVRPFQAHEFNRWCLSFSAPWADKVVQELTVTEVCPGSWWGPSVHGHIDPSTCLCDGNGFFPRKLDSCKSNSLSCLTYNEKLVVLILPWVV